MLGKLIKYDMRYAMRSLMIVFAVFIGLSLLTISFSIGNLSFLEIDIVFMVLAVPLAIVLGVMYFVTTVQLYSKSLFGKEGYLTQTLPVHPEMLLLSKILTALIWGIACIAIVLIYVFAIMLTHIPISELFESARAIIQELQAIEVLSALLLALTSALQWLSCILLCCAISAIPLFRDRNMGIPAGIISYFLISLLTGQLTTRIITEIIDAAPIMTYDMVSQTREFLTQTFAISSLISLGLAAAYFFLAAYIMRKHKAL